ncbi:hypothetical protein [Nostoc sp. DSM 114167]|uniref:hypothetical protein n=1 Tax=Nostoc sp. DSM 114167 TaxID=3439050 RepID=UPI0040459001
MTSGNLRNSKVFTSSMVVERLALSFDTSTAPFGYAQDRLSASLRGNRATCTEFRLRGNRAKSRFNYRLVEVSRDSTTA